jgi:hypothetical protein
VYACDCRSPSQEFHSTSTAPKLNNGGVVLTPTTSVDYFFRWRNVVAVRSEWQAVGVEIQLSTSPVVTKMSSRTAPRRSTSSRNTFFRRHSTLTTRHLRLSSRVQQNFATSTIFTIVLSGRRFTTFVGHDLMQTEKVQAWLCAFPSRTSTCEQPYSSSTYA